MTRGILNLTRKCLPAFSNEAKKNLHSIQNMPEMILAKMRNTGDKSILYVPMNHCRAAIINENGIKTVYTDALNGCNSVAASIKLKNGENLFILSHYVPTNVEGQINALEKQLEVYKPYFNSNQSPNLFFNIRGHEPNGTLEIVANPIIESAKELFAKFFIQKSNTYITPYKNQKRPAYFSSANIFQFNPQNLNQLKITYAGEKESLILLG